MNKENSILKLPEYIKNLDTKYIYNNLLHYTYHAKYLKKLQKSDIDQEDPHYISTYSSFVGEVFENITYELLIRYVLKNGSITKFILKGPHQNHSQNLKSGFMCDFNSQIVYKSGYKDITEFDALFFTKDSVYFVESTIVKTTTSLRKRLKKKRALLTVLFPNLSVKALIILNEGALGTKVFPSYCTVWLTKPLRNKTLINELIRQKPPTNKFQTFKNSKLDQAKNIKTANFKYFDTISWILKKSRNNQNKVLDFSFLSSDELSLYFDIYSKLYIGYITSETFVKTLKELKIQNISEDIEIDKIEDDTVYITIEKSDNNFTFVYYVKLISNKLKKLELNTEDSILNVSTKDPKGFTVAEIKFVKYLLTKKYIISFEQLKLLYQSI